MNHSVIKLKENALDVSSISFACERLKDSEKIEEFLRKNYDLNCNNRVMLIGYGRTKIINGKVYSYFEIFNDRDLKPIEIDLDIEIKDKLVLVYGNIFNGKISLNKYKYLDSNKINFGNIKSELGFKILTNSVITEIDLRICEFKEKLIKTNSLIFKINEYPYYNRKEKIKVLGRLASNKSEFDIQILKVLEVLS